MIVDQLAARDIDQNDAILHLRQRLRLIILFRFRLKAVCRVM